MRTVILTIIHALFLSACGAEEPLTWATGVEVRWDPQIDCTLGEADLSVNMRATLDIAGHDRCTLDVDAGDLTASGSCDEITIGIVRPLGLGYWYANGSELIPLAYIIGWVDLRTDDLAGRTTVAVNLNGDGVTSEQIDTDAERAALPSAGDCTGFTDENQLELCKAKAWANEYQLTENSVDFNRDYPQDEDSNLVEACAGTLLE